MEWNKEAKLNSSNYPVYVIVGAQVTAYDRPTELKMRQQNSSKPTSAVLERQLF
jgi:hypothetical protein